MNSASTYRDTKRKGVNTPDENLQIKIIGATIKPGIKKVIDSIIHNSSGMAEINIVGNFFNGQDAVGTSIIYNQHYEDGLILSMSTELSVEIMHKLGKEAVIKIINLNDLIKSIDKQLGITGIAKECEYAQLDERNHFLKSISDSWQKEYRIIWPNINAKNGWLFP